jgi:hypothetical protein
MNYYIPKNLLGKSNAKTVKGEKLGFITYIMYLAPAKQNATGKTVCSHASQGCIDACLFKAGRGGFTSVERARINKTNYLLGDRKGFLNQLRNEIGRMIIRHEKKGEKICIRLNGTSDLAFEKFKIEDNKSLMELFPDVQFYDYTKNHFRFNKIMPKNYHLTFSRSEENETMAEQILSQGGNVAVVFDELPDTYKGFKVVNGDLSDLRFLDEKNVVVGLIYKKIKAKDADHDKIFDSGFGIRKKDLDAVNAA